MNKKIKISNFQFGTSFILKTYIIISLLLFCTNSFSQYNENKWIISASFDAVDLYPTGIKTDAPYYPQGGIFEDLFNVSDHWNFGGPSVSISKLIYKGLYFGTELSINKIKKIEGQDNFDYTFYGGQVFLKKTFYSTKKARPFLKLGYGISGIDRGLFGDTIPFSQYFSKTLSPGFGVHFRITNNFGFEISSSFNKAIDFGGITHLRHKAAIYIGIGDRDRDGDGIINRKDKCPKIPGLPEFNGCPDNDGDGIPDLEDKCPNEPGVKLNNGCPEKDEALDENNLMSDKNKELQLGVVSSTFSKNTTNTKEESSNQEVLDENNSMSNKNKELQLGVVSSTFSKNTTNTRQESNNQISKDISNISFLINKKLDENRIIYFPAGSIKILGKKNLVKLRGIFKLITNQKDLKVLLEGHSSDDGDSLSNLELSRDRAIIIKQTLIDLGTDPGRIKIKALGEEEPIFDNKSINGDRFNRSVLITLYQE
ncbi:OmpA family protein [Flavobacteriaceae bacterium]|nr:OmpA family protein [Flavobacteriaceae bacterium]MDB4255553.1 OmpA family protein [Flavobacteriaceae bacterium]